MIHFKRCAAFLAALALPMTIVRRSGYDKNDHIKGGDFYDVSHGISFILTALRIC